jgi:zinc protease
MTIAVVGDVDPAAVIARLRGALERAAEERAEPAAAPPAAEGAPTDPPVDPLPTEPRLVSRFLNKQQAHLVVGFPGTTIVHPDRFALELLATILSGQGGRLFVELRDKRSLAYRVSAFSLEGIDPGYFAVYMATSPSNLEVARAGIREELDKVMDHPVGEAELERAKRYLVGADDISLQRRAALASTLAFNECYGLGWDEYKRYGETVLAVTAADVQRVAREYLDPRRAVIAVVQPDEVMTAARHRVEAAQAARAKRNQDGKHGPSRGKKRHRRRR